MRSVIAARELAVVCNLMDSERMFVAGLLSGIGHLIMYQSVPVLAQQAQPGARESGRPLYLIEIDAKTGHGRTELFPSASWQRNRRAKSTVHESASGGCESPSQNRCLPPK